MQLPTFREYLDLVSEDVDQEVTKLMTDLSTIDAQIVQRTQPLLNRKQQLQKLLAVKRKQLETQQRQQPQQAQQSAQPTAQGTTTPGGTGAGTPGSTS